MSNIDLARVILSGMWQLACMVCWYQLPLRQAHDLTVRDLCTSCADELRRWLERKGE